MAANDYYNSQPNYYSSQSSRPNDVNSNTPAAYAAYNPSSSAPYGSSTMDNTFGSDPPPAHTPYQSSSSRPPVKESHESIPLQSTKLNTSQAAFQKQSTHYPPSPESQQNNQLLPERPRKKKKKGFFAGPIPWVVYITTLVQVSVFIAEIIKSSIVTGSPIMIHPTFNPMIGPSPYIQINMGARFVPCMRADPDVAEIESWRCPASTTSEADDPNNHCSLADLCGFGMEDNSVPNQWYRFIIPMFLHAGLIHISFNMLLQIFLGRELEKIIGSIRFALVYFPSGIFGFVLGGNYAGKAQASTGASGCLFGILALDFLDLFYHWRERASPMKDLIWALVGIVLSFVLGLLPGLDNFAHIGGFIMGLAIGICILHSPGPLRERMGDAAMPYRNVGSDPDLSNPKTTRVPKKTRTTDYAAFTKQPIGFFKGRKPLWWGWWLFRAGALIGVLAGFIVLLNNFYKYHVTCDWCKYLSCINVSDWCEMDSLGQGTDDTKDKRSLAMTGAAIFREAMRK